MSRGTRLALSAVCAGGLLGCMHQQVEIVSPTVLRDTVATLEIPAGAAVLVGTGDIADCETLPGAGATGDLVRAVLERVPDAIVFTTGDHAYPDGSAQDYRDCYTPTWGEFADRTVPTPGNHDYETPGAEGYFDYFPLFERLPGARPSSYYHFRHGTWLVVVLNSLLKVEPGSVQVRWLERVLNEQAAECVVAIWHHPLRSSGFHGFIPWDPGRDTRAFWDVLIRHGADIVLNGHDHLYERFAKRDPRGAHDESGLRQFTVGTGGAGLHPIVRQRRDSKFLTNDVYGVLLLALGERDYTWAFVGTDGRVHDRSAAPAAC